MENCHPNTPVRQLVPQVPEVPDAFTMAPTLKVLAELKVVWGFASTLLILLASRLTIHTVVAAWAGRVPKTAITRKVAARTTGTVLLVIKEARLLSDSSCFDVSSRSHIMVIGKRNAMYI